MRQALSWAKPWRVGVLSSNSNAPAKVLSSSALGRSHHRVFDGPYPLWILGTASLPHTLAEHRRAVDPKQPLSGDQDTLFIVSHMVARTLAGEDVLRKEPRNSLVLRAQKSSY